MNVLYPRMRSCMGCHTGLENCQFRAPTISRFKGTRLYLSPSHSSQFASCKAHCIPLVYYVHAAGLTLAAACCNPVNKQAIDLES